MLKKENEKLKDKTLNELSILDPKTPKSNKERSKEFRERKKKEMKILETRVSQLENELNRLTAENIALKAQLKIALKNTSKNEF